MSIKLKDTIYDLIDNADKLDGVHNGNLTAKYFAQGDILTSSDTINKLMSGIYCYINANNPTGSIDDNAILLAFRNSGRTDMIQFVGAANSEKLYYRRAANIGNQYENWTSWKTIAFIDSKVNNAGYADSAGTANSVAWSNVSGKPSTFSPSSHTHEYASTIKVGTTSYTSSSNTISLPAYPTLSSLGAAAASHSHSYLPLSGGTLTGNLVLEGNGSYRCIHVGKETGYYTALHNSAFTGDSREASISWYNNGTHQGSIAVSTYPFFVNSSNSIYKIWHAGNDGSGSGLDADTVDACHIDEGIPYAYSYTSSGSGTWYLKISASMWGNFHGIVFVSSSGNNCAGRLIVHTGSRTNNYWGWCLGYNGVGITGIHKDISGDTANIYLRLTFPNATIKTTFPATITNTQSGHYDEIPADGGLFGDVFTGYATSAGSVAWGNVSGKPSSFTPSSHTHNSVTDYSNGTAITFQYSTGGFTSNPSWLGAWNGYQLTYVSPSVLSVNYASSAGSVAWGNVSGKPNIFTQIGGKSIDFNFADGNNNNGLYYLHTNWTQSNKNGISYGSLMNFSVDASSWQLLSSSDSYLYYRQRWWSGGGGNWSGWKRIAFHSEIPTKTSQLTNDSGFLTSLPSHSHSYLPLSGGTMNAGGTITTAAMTSASVLGGMNCGGTGIYLTGYSSSALLVGGELRFSTTKAWDYDTWAGLKYVHSSKVVYLGLADKSAFTANNAQSGGSLYTPGISNIYIGNGTYVVLNSNNWSSYCAAKSHSHDYMTTSSPTGSGTLMMNGSNSRGSYPAVKWHIGNVNWAQLIMNGSGELELRGGASQDTGYATLRTGAMICTSLYVGSDQITFTT